MSRTLVRIEWVTATARGEAWINPANVAAVHPAKAGRSLIVMGPGVSPPRYTVDLSPADLAALLAGTPAGSPF